MEANEAPEKIYLDSYGSGFSHGFHTNKLYDNDVEYTRTDALIEKACKWLREGGNGWYLSSEFGEDEIDFVKLAEDFRKAMENE